MSSHAWSSTARGATLPLKGARARHSRVETREATRNNQRRRRRVAKSPSAVPRKRRKIRRRCRARTAGHSPPRAAAATATKRASELRRPLGDDGDVRQLRDHYVQCGCGGGAYVGEEAQRGRFAAEQCADASPRSSFARASRCAWPGRTPALLEVEHGAPDQVVAAGQQRPGVDHLDLDLRRPHHRPVLNVTLW